MAGLVKTISPIELNLIINISSKGGFVMSRRRVPIIENEIEESKPEVKEDAQCFFGGGFLFFFFFMIIILFLFGFGGFKY